VVVCPETIQSLRSHVERAKEISDEPWLDNHIDMLEAEILTSWGCRTEACRVLQSLHTRQSLLAHQAEKTLKLIRKQKCWNEGR